MRLLRAAWTSLVIAGMVVFGTATFIVARHMMSLVTEATPTAGNSGPASVDGLLNGLADTIDGVASTTGVGSAHPIRQSAEKLRSLQRDIGGSQQGFDKLSGALDGALGGGPGEALAEAVNAPPGDGPVRKPATQKPATEKPAAGKPAAQKPVAEKPAAQQPAPHRPTRIE